MDRADRADQEDPVVETGRMETEPVDRGVEQAGSGGTSGSGR